MDNSAMDDFTRAYITCALWSSSDADDIPLDSLYDVSDIASNTIARIESDCAKFYRANESHICLDCATKAGFADSQGNLKTGVGL